MLALLAIFVCYGVKKTREVGINSTNSHLYGRIINQGKSDLKKLGSRDEWADSWGLFPYIEYCRPGYNTLSF
jgi:hypothetical protein